VVLIGLAKVSVVIATLYCLLKLLVKSVLVKLTLRNVSCFHLLLQYSNIGTATSVLSLYIHTARHAVLVLICLE
jgi:hypothetical protein